MTEKSILSLQKKGAEFVKLLEEYDSITIISHINPDADTIGTALGIYQILRKKYRKKRIEIVNTDSELPVYLDFLRGYEKIKRDISFENSIVIACDCGSLDRLGADVADRVIVNIDHHYSNTFFGRINAVEAAAVSSSEVAYYFLKPFFEIGPDSAESFYTALISDSRYFTTSAVSRKTFELAGSLISLGADPIAIAGNLVQRRSLASLRVLSMALKSLRLKFNGHIAIMTIDQKSMEICGAKPRDIEGIIDYARSLACVRIAIMMVEMRDYIKVSLRSKNCDIVTVASNYGGGGHKYAAGFEAKGISMEDLEVDLLETLKTNRLQVDHER